MSLISALFKINRSSAKPQRTLTETERKKEIDDWVQNHPSRTVHAGNSYETIYPIAMYAPWNLNTEFLSVLEKVSSKNSNRSDTNSFYTLVDKYRLWELFTLTQETCKLARGDYLEVGVWRGGSAAVIATALSSKKDSSQIYLADTFAGVVKATAEDTHYVGGEHAETSVEVVDILLKSINFNSFKILKGIFPEDTADAVPKNTRFRLVHIDVDVYLSAKDIFSYAWPKLVKGGMIVFDDYGFMGCDGVTKLVEELKASTLDGIFLHNLNGHSVVVKI